MKTVEERQMQQWRSKLVRPEGTYILSINIKYFREVMTKKKEVLTSKNFNKQNVDYVTYPY